MCKKSEKENRKDGGASIHRTAVAGLLEVGMVVTADRKTETD